jgi:hypothetical protein
LFFLRIYRQDKFCFHVGGTGRKLVFWNRKVSSCSGTEKKALVLGRKGKHVFWNGKSTCSETERKVHVLERKRKHVFWNESDWNYAPYNETEIMC